MAPYWTDSNHTKLLGLVIRHAKLSKRDLEVLAEEMGGGCTWRTIQRHLYYLRKKGESQSPGPSRRGVQSAPSTPRAGRDSIAMEKGAMQAHNAEDTDDEIEVSEVAFDGIKREVVEVNEQLKHKKPIVKLEMEPIDLS